MQHTKTTTITALSPDTNEIKFESYTDELKLRKIKHEQSIITSRATFLGDIMKCLDILSSKQSHDLTIHIEANEYHEPTRIVKTWTVSKENYGR